MRNIDIFDSKLLSISLILLSIKYRVCKYQFKRSACLFSKSTLLNSLKFNVVCTIRLSPCPHPFTFMKGLN